jgi:hypothetical protein
VHYDAGPSFEQAFGIPGTSLSLSSLSGANTCNMNLLEYFNVRIELLLAVKKVLYITLKDISDCTASMYAHTTDASDRMALLQTLLEQKDELVSLYTALGTDILEDHPSKEVARVVDKVKITSVTLSSGPTLSELSALKQRFESCVAALRDGFQT